MEITGCAFLYSSGLSTMVIQIPEAVNHIEIDHDTFENQAAGHTANGIIRIGNFRNRTPKTAVTDVRVTGNTFENVAPTAVSVLDDVYRVTISNNDITTVVGTGNYPAINVQAVNPGSAAQQVVVTDNKIVKGTLNNCIQIQSLNSSRTMIRNVTVTGNVCRIEPGASGSTGYSMVGISGLTETGNVFDSAAETIVSGNPAFEITGDQEASVTDNVATMGTKILGTSGFAVLASTVNATRNVTLSGNSVTMRVAGTKPGSCFYVGSSFASTVEQITITGNTCNLSGSTTTGMIRGVWVQSNHDRAFVRNGVISGNILIGTTKVHSRGIHLERDSGTLSGWHIGQNRQVNWSLRSSPSQSNPR